MGQLYCEVCRRTMNEDQFYRSNNLEKYPLGGHFTKCKKCLTMMVDNFNPDTYLWILQEADVPYVPEEWDNLLMRYGKNPEKLTGMTIIGRYLAKMQLKQFRDFRWKDNEFLQELARTKAEQAMERQGYTAAQIAKTIQENTIQLPTEELAIPDLKKPDPQEISAPTANFEAVLDDEDIEIEKDLTEEDKKYLIMKWGKTYKPSEWVSLEQLYNEMLKSYDIQAAGDINTLKLACKTSLKANQLLDIGDVDGAQKMTKMYDGLMKSGKWTAAQNKAQDDEEIDSIGELVAMCERDGFIPRYYTSGPQDHVDRVLEDLQKYTMDLIANESGLGNMIESALKQMEEEKEKIKAAAENDAEDEINKMFNYEEEVIADQAYSDFKDFEQSLSNEDDKFYDSLLRGDDD